MTFEADNTISRWRVEQRQWREQREAQRESNRLVLAELAFHLERMESANEEFYLSPRSVDVICALTSKLKSWETGL